MVGTQSTSSLPTELRGTTLEQGRVGCDIPARPEQSWVQEVRPVRSSNDKYLSGGMKAIKLSQELRDNSAGCKTAQLGLGKSPTVTLSHQTKRGISEATGRSMGWTSARISLP